VTLCRIFGAMGACVQPTRRALREAYNWVSHPIFSVNRACFFASRAFENKSADQLDQSCNTAHREKADGDMCCK